MGREEWRVVVIAKERRGERLRWGDGERIVGGLVIAKEIRVGRWEEENIGVSGW